MDVFIIIVGILLLAIGFVGCILPVLPGPAFGYLALLVLLFHSNPTTHLSNQTLLISGLFVLTVTLLDYILPVWGTKKFGGTKAGKNGSLIGLVFGLFVSPWGILIGPFIGAVIGELLGGSDKNIALKSGVGSFLGFAAGAILKIATLVFLSILFIQQIL